MFVGGLTLLSVTTQATIGALDCHHITLVGTGKAPDTVCALSLEVGTRAQGVLKEMRKQINWQRKRLRLLSNVQSKSVETDGQLPKHLRRTGSQEDIIAQMLSW